MRNSTSSKPTPKLLVATASLSALLAQTACELPQTVQAGNTLAEVEEVPRPNAVCNSFGANDPSLGSNYGLIANLWYVPQGGSSLNTVAAFQQSGTKLDATLYLNQLNVPTRAFDRGFQTQNGTILQTPEGNTLYEYFSIRAESVIKLSNHETPGRYQFAVLADDGAVMYVNDTGNGFRSIVNNDGTHATKLACAGEGIDLTYDSRLPIAVDYYQGPRFHIALMVLWRKLPDANASSLTDSACGLSGNDRFFDSSQSPSVPSQTYLDLLSRGWSVVAPQNYLLPLNSPMNPCNGTNPPPAS